MPPKRPVIVIDLDGTILGRNALDWFRLYLWRSNKAGKPFLQATETLKELSKRYCIVALTARAELGKANTRRWLDANGLEFVELYLSSRFHFREPTRAAFKTAVLARLKSEGYDLRYGMGDRPSDFVAYIKNGMYPVVVLRPKQAGIVKKFVALASRLELGPGSYQVVFERPDAPAWPRIADFIKGREKGRG